MSETLKVWDKLMKSGDIVTSEVFTNIPPVPTPSPSVNWATEGGITPGNIYCLEGQESSGKSFFAMECVPFSRVSPTVRRSSPTSKPSLLPEETRLPSPGNLPSLADEPVVRPSNGEVKKIRDLFSERQNKGLSDEMRACISFLSIVNLRTPGLSGLPNTDWQSA